MYRNFFHLTETPFSIAPDPRFLYMSARHREAIAHLLFGVRGSGGFVLLTGEIGTGKTTLCRCLLEQINEQCDVAFILNPRLSAGELLAAICEEFRIAVPSGRLRIKPLVDAINAHLLSANAADRRAVLIIDEAQNLFPNVLEQLRLLTNLETSTRKLLQIILIGQPELRTMLAQPEMAPVAQRIVARYHLTHLTRDELPPYVQHRLSIAGTRVSLFPTSLIAPLFRATRGVPRVINMVCDRALLGAYVQGSPQVTPQILRQATNEVLGTSPLRRLWQQVRPRLALVSAMGVGSVALAGGYLAPTAWPVSMPGIAATIPASGPAQAPGAATGSGAATGAMAGGPSQLPSSGADAGNAVQTPLPEDAATNPTDPTDLSGDQAAFRDLFALYGVAYAPRAGLDPCDGGTAGDWRCLRPRGSLSYLLQFNQPAVLTMAGNGAPHQVLLVARHGLRSAVVKEDGKERRMRLADIAAAWSGEFVMVWREPADADAPLVLGSRGPAVLKLRRDLAKAVGGNPEGSASFDAELFERVKSFQLAEGIPADGVAGPLTMVRLNLRLDKSLPRLAATPAYIDDVLHS